jgi:hypothetical protein
MQNTKYKIQISIFAAFLAMASGAQAMMSEPIQEPPSTSTAIVLTSNILDESLVIEKQAEAIQFRHGDVSWLPELASQAGWPKNTWKRLGQIILRESGGCPNRIGSSIVDKNCNITGYTRATNRSDSGLLQINGVNWDPKRSGTQLLCAEYKICTQEQLLDAVTNLKAGYILYQRAGWGPWDPCQWGPAYASRCVKSASMP